MARNLLNPRTRKFFAHQINSGAITEELAPDDADFAKRAAQVKKTGALTG